MGRFKLYCAIAYLGLGDKEKAAEFINEDFELYDVKEGELSISDIWKEIYGNTKPVPQNIDFSLSQQ